MSTRTRRYLPPTLLRRTRSELSALHPEARTVLIELLEDAYETGYNDGIDRGEDGWETVPLTDSADEVVGMAEVRHALHPSHPAHPSQAALPLRLGRIGEDLVSEMNGDRH